MTDTDRDDAQSVSASLDRTLGYGGYRWLDEGTILGVIGDEGWTRLCRFDVNADDPERTFPAQSRLETIQRGGAVDVGGGVVAGCFSDAETGTDIYAFDVSDLEDSDDPRRRLTTVNDELLAKVEQPTCLRLGYESSDDESVEAIVYAPSSFDIDDPEEHPLLLKIHGGPMSYDAPGWGFDEQYFVDQGISYWK